MTLAGFADPHFRQAQYHYGVGPAATPFEVAMSCIRQAAQDMEACIAQDPSIAHTLDVPHGLLAMLAEVLEEQADG